MRDASNDSGASNASSASSACGVSDAGNAERDCAGSDALADRCRRCGWEATES